MTTNRLARSAPIDIDSNPLTSAEVARKWARWARESGKHDLAEKWDIYAMSVA